MKNTIPEVDAYIDRAAEFAQPILKKLRQLFHHACPEIQETLKWSSPFFEFKGILGNMSAFTQHVSYGFWKAGLMSDPEGILEKAGNTEMAVLKARSLDDLPDDAVLICYIEEAVQLNEMGIKVPRTRPTEAIKELVIPDDIRAALRQSEKAFATFETFSYSNRKEYVEWVTEAKRQSTREKRLATALEWMAEGKPRNWKYMKDWR
jgi:uncharacterized protein YdeI (YjbR/CyaY-like superfamily)